jgi:hypothetical protein
MADNAKNKRSRNTRGHEGRFSGASDVRLYDWGNEVESNAVDVLIHYVRRKFDKEIVRNVRGIGWMIPETGR